MSATMKITGLREMFAAVTVTLNETSTLIVKITTLMTKKLLVAL